jgi:tetratricopeptide (TPR) repeat protein
LMMRVRHSILLLLLLTTADRALLYAQDTRSLEQRLAQEFDYDDPKGTESRLSALSREAQAKGDIASLADILTQVARAQALQGHLEEAASTLDRAAALSTEAVRPRVRLLIERGRLLRRQGHPQDARVSFEKAYETAAAAEQPGLAADAAHMLALMLPFEESRTWTDRGLVLAEQSSDPTVRHWVGVLMNNWGERLDEQGDHEGAALAFARALAARRLENDASVSRASEFALAVQLRKLGLAAQALAIQDRLQQEATSAKEPVGEILIEKVENLRALNRKNEARRAAEEALRSLLTQGAPAEQIDHLRSVLKDISGAVSP